MYTRNKGFGFLYLVVFLTTIFPVTSHAACKKLVMTFAENWDGISYLDSTGKPTGYAIEIHQRIFKTLGITLDLLPNIPWKRQLHILDQGQSDAIAAMNFNKQRAQDYVLSDELRATPVRIFAHTDRPITFNNLEDLAQYRGALTRGASFGAAFDSFVAQNKSILQINGTLNIVQLLESNRIDWFVLPQDLGESLVRAAGSEGQIQPVGAPVFNISIRAAFSRNSECKTLVPAFNQTLRQLQKDGYLNTLNNKHFSG